MSKTTLQTKITDLKKRSGFIQYRAFNIAPEDIEVAQEFDKRIIKGYLCKWGNKNMFNEKLVKGSCAKSIQERGPNSTAKYKIVMLWMHDMTDPLGTFAVLKEDDYGLYFETNPLDDVPNADRAIKQIKSGTINQFSIGFYYIWDKIEYDDKDDSLVLLEIDFIEGSVVTMGADDGAYAIRSGLLTPEVLYDNIEDFINTLPKKDRLQARQLFSQQKALVANENAKEQLNKHKPPEKRANKKKKTIDYLIKNLN